MKRVEDLSSEILSCFIEVEDIIDGEALTTKFSIFTFLDTTKFSIFIRYPSLYEKFTSKSILEKEFSITFLNNSFNKMKLPKIETQHFDGHSDLWIEFYYNFQCAIH